MTVEQAFLVSLAALTLAAESVPASSNQQMKLTYYSDWPLVRLKSFL
jgi:hypothetical protein